MAAALAVVLGSACRGGPPDLSRGGVELVYAPRFPEQLVAPQQRAHAFSETRSRVVSRLEEMRIPAVVGVEAGRLRVALPAGTPESAISRAKSFLSAGVRLEFREVDEEALASLTSNVTLWRNLPAAVKLVPSQPGPVNQRGSELEAPSREAAAEAIEALTPGVPAGKVLALQSPQWKLQPWRILVLGPASLDNDGIAEARVMESQGRPVVRLRLRQEASASFERFSRRIVGRRLAITLDGAVLTAPWVTAPMPGGDVQIDLGTAGPHLLERTREMASFLTGGSALPVPLVLEAERAIPPSHGR